MRIMKPFLFLISCHSVQYGIVHYFEKKENKLYLGVSNWIDDNGKPTKPKGEIAAEECKYESRGNLNPDIDGIIEMLDYSEIEPDELIAIREFPNALLQDIKDRINQLET